MNNQSQHSMQYSSDPIKHNIRDYNKYDLDHVRQLTRSNNMKHNIGEDNHLATAMDP